MTTTIDPTLRLETGRLVLRSFEQGDAPGVIGMIESGEELLPPDAPKRPEDVAAWLDGGADEVRRAGDGINLAMIDTAGVLVGVISLHHINWAVGRAEVGYGVCPDHRGRGYATEALRVLTRWVLRDGGLRRVELRAAADNRISHRVAEMTGFSREGVLRGAAADGRDVVIFGLLAADLATAADRPAFRETRLKTDRLVLRPFAERDTDDLFAAVSDDPELGRWMPWTADYSRDKALRWCTSLAHVGPRDGINFAIVPCELDRMSGAVGLTEVDWVGCHAEIGYWVAPWARRSGYASEAVRAVVAYAFDMGLRRIELFAAADNHVSQRVAQKVGFTREGLMREALTIPAGRTDAVIFSLLDGELT